MLKCIRRPARPRHLRFWIGVKWDDMCVFDAFQDCVKRTIFELVLKRKENVDLVFGAPCEMTLLNHSHEVTELRLKYRLN